MRTNYIGTWIRTADVVTFMEDDCRVRKANAPENLATLRKLALQIITHTNDKLSLKKRRVKAAFDIEYLKKLVK